jgi:hypothetical protein
VKTLILAALLAVIACAASADLARDQENQQYRIYQEQQAELMRGQLELARKSDDRARRAEIRADAAERNAEMEESRKRSFANTPPIDLAGMNVMQKAHYIGMARSGWLRIYDSSGGTDQRHLNHTQPAPPVDQEAARRLAENDRVAEIIVREQRAHEAALKAEREKHQREIEALRAESSASASLQTNHPSRIAKDSAEFRRLEQESTQRAIATWPELGPKGSAERKKLQEFIDAYYNESPLNPALFDDPTWPEYVVAIYMKRKVDGRIQ